MRKCCACERWFDHRHHSACPRCGTVPLTLQKLQAENARLRAQVTQLQEHNTTEVERRRKAEAARDVAIKGMTAYLRICGDLEAQLRFQMVKLPGHDAMLLVLEELLRAKLKYPHFATGIEQAFAVLQRESGELADAVVKGDTDGEHGIIREAAQVAAVAMRIIELCHRADRRCGDCGRPVGFDGCDGCRFASDHPLWIPKTIEPQEASA